MPDTPETLAGRLADEGLKTQGFFNSLRPEQWEIKVYTEGTQWKIRQILTHFVSSEVSFTELIEDVLQGGSGAPEDFDIDAYNEQQVLEMQAVSNAELLARYVQARRRNVGLVSAMTVDDLLKEGRHPFLGLASLADMIKLIYRHNQIHQRDMRKLLD